MKLAVLNCDEIKPSFSEKFGQYPAMFETALNNLDIKFNIASYDIQKKESIQKILMKMTFI